jgi:Tfp pilus assembly protein PilN
MKYSINLASQPFRRYRAMFVASAAVCVLLVFTLGALISMILADRAQMADVRADILRLNNEIRKVTNEQAKVAATMRRPENAEVFERSIFINTLLMRKSISWTKIFADLEKILPHNVRVISIHPAVNAQNQIVLEMSVGAEQTEPLLQLLIKLENSEQFGHTAVSSIQPPSQSEPLFRYKVNVNYVQKF